MWLPVVLLVSIGSSPAKAPNLHAVLERAGEYVRAQAEALPHLVAEERLTQTIQPAPTTAGTRQTRLLRSDFAWVRLVGIPEAMGVRDVREVNGAKVGGTNGRLDQMLRGVRPLTAAEARQILDESARYNLAPGSRNINLPTFVLFLLHPDVQPRFKWHREGSASESAWRVKFKERERPTLIRTAENTAVFSQGYVWIDPDDGHVSRTELYVTIRGATYRMSVTFAPHATLGVVVPASLDEFYETPESSVEGHATYTNYRRFETGARLLP
jgi:hypothetical protein